MSAITDYICIVPISFDRRDEDLTEELTDALDLKGDLFSLFPQLPSTQYNGIILSLSSIHVEKIQDTLNYDPQ